MNETEKFFYDNAGWSHSPDETSEQGRVRGARELARAEVRLKGGPYFTTLEGDPEPWQGDFPYDGPLWIVTLWSVDDTTDEPTILGSLGGVAAEEGDPYLRVIAAELAAEYIPGEAA